MSGLRFNWIYLVLAVIVIAALAHSGGRWGRWMFGIAIIGVLLTASKALMPSAAGGS